jgi:hypothetical protein
MSSFWLNGNGYFVIEGGKAIRCDNCPCISYLTKLQLKVIDGVAVGGEPVIIEVDMTLGATTTLNLTVIYLGNPYGVQMEMTPNGPSFVCGTNIEELTFDFKFIVDEELPTNAVKILNTVVLPANVNCVFPESIQRIPYEETLERHTAFVSHCQCSCLDDPEAFRGTFGIRTQRPDGPTPLNLSESFDPVDPENDIRFEVRYCYERCPVEEESEE